MEMNSNSFIESAYDNHYHNSEVHAANGRTRSKLREYDTSGNKNDLLEKAIWLLKTMQEAGWCGDNETELLEELKQVMLPTHKENTAAGLDSFASGNRLDDKGILIASALSTPSRSLSNDLNLHKDIRQVANQGQRLENSNPTAVSPAGYGYISHEDQRATERSRQRPC